jgi:zinc transport system substrate-binding protein
MWRGGLCLLFCFLSVCQGPQDSSFVKEKPLVLVSIAPYAYFVDKIGGEMLQTLSIVPSGVNMHIYEPTIQQLTLVKKARIWFLVGEPFEKRIVRLLEQQDAKVKMVSLWKNIPLLQEKASHSCSHHGDEESSDMHLWTSPKLMAIQCERIAKELSMIEPNYAEEYAIGLQAVEKELTTLDRKIRQLLKPLAGSAILVSHPALGYFCREYELIQLSVECAEKDPLPRDIERILEEAKRYNVQAVFTQKGYSNKGAELIAERLKLPVFRVDPYAEDYSENLLRIAELIANPSLGHLS